MESESFRRADEQARLWISTLKAKKAALENLLNIQRALEEVELSVAKHLPRETVEGAHARFLSPLNPTEPEALYLLTVGRAVISPLSSRIRFTEGLHFSPFIGSKG